MSARLTIGDKVYLERNGTKAYGVIVSDDYDSQPYKVQLDAGPTTGWLKMSEVHRVPVAEQLKGFLAAGKKTHTVKDIWKHHEQQRRIFREQLSQPFTKALKVHS